MRQLFSMALLVILVSNSSYANENNVVTHRDTGIVIRSPSKRVIHKYICRCKEKQDKDV